MGDSILYDYVPQGVIHIDSHVTSCQGMQVRLGSQMVEESLVLTQNRFEPQLHCNYLCVHQAMTRREGDLWIDES